MMPIERVMTVVYAPGCSGVSKPMIRIKSELIKTVGFDVGTAILVSYQREKITITKLK